MNTLNETMSVKAQGKYRTNHSRWTAVINRDPNANGAFYYSVKTTGVYCRPSCAARTPRRVNVQFHTSCADAEKAGFRPCKRCQPNSPALPEQYATKVAAACRTIESAEDIPALEALARTTGLSRYHFHRIFKKFTGLTPKAYAKAHREKRLRSALSNRTTITEAIYEAGFNSNSRFYAKSTETLGMLPKNFRKGGKGETIHFALGKCSLGYLLVATSAKGICAITLGDDSQKLTEDLQVRFSQAKLIAADKSFRSTIAQVIAFVEAPAVGLDLPLDIRGTAFQQRVWQSLRKLPAGRTVSYTELAKRIGSPKAVRAVASACAANQLAVAVPCHRVLRTDGQLSGYRWGVARKRALLQKEKK